MSPTSPERRLHQGSPVKDKVRAAVRALKTRDPCRGTQGHMEAVAAEQATAESDRDTGALFVLPAAGTAAERTFTHSVGATVGSVSVAHTVRVWVDQDRGRWQGHCLGLCWSQGGIPLRCLQVAAC